MALKIALAGNPNCGKTTLFNALTGSNQFVGNWPGVTVEKKEGKLKNHKDVVIMDLPGIYSLSPYTLEEVVARNYLINEKPDAILNIVDGTNIERNLYLSTQLMELGIPVVMAVNMADILEKTGDKINLAQLSKALGCEVVSISALKGTGIKEAADKAVALAQASKVAFGEAMFDPTMVLYYLDNKIIVLISALGTVAATITTCVAANVVAPANGIANINPKKISYKAGVIIAVLFAFFILQAWWIYGSGAAYFTWMNAYGTILSPIAAILIADYWIVKKQRIDVNDLFKGPQGRYWYSGGWNWAAVISWVCAFILPLLLYFGASGPFFAFVNSINYVWSFFVAFILYIILMKTSLAGNSYVTEEEHEAFTKRA